jgi:hypothetical protein
MVEELYVLRLEGLDLTLDELVEFAQFGGDLRG